MGALELHAEGIVVRFGGITAVSDVSLDARRSQVLGLIGPNGAGKTTLLNALSGFAPLSAGKVTFGDTDVTTRTPQWRARRGLVRSFQAVRVFEGLTVRENVEVGAVGTGRRRRAARGATVDLLALTGLGRLADRPASSLPAGQQRQLSLARALAARPVFLLLDEPAAGLDEGESEELAAAIRRIPTEFDAGVVLVEHDMSVVMKVCDRIQVLDHGSTIAVGERETIRTDPEVIRAYLGEQSTADGGEVGA
ncbi:MAG: ABC transporter ATP-binding protein [Actinobacteria bacterium]|nr:ABC transporter ATP-binding protein [Actinomycetota bacterium]OJU82913.1 MAG: ABC transporter ATP-binding protein [Solirubrobacterales bacterium 70-9]